MEPLLHALAHYVALAVEAIAIVVIAFGSARALAGICRVALSPSRQRELGSQVVTLETDTGWSPGSPSSLRRTS